MNDVLDRIRADRAEAESRAERNRASMPGVAAIVDHVRGVFGPGVRVLWAKEGEREIGRREAE